MSTQDVPGANPANHDVLAAGCWAEHEDGSLLYVKGTENQQVVYELYDVAIQPPRSYQDAMREAAFKSQFSFPPVGQSAEKWTWHDKTPFPWSRVMTAINRPTPQYADVAAELSVAAKVAESLRLRAHEVHKSDIAANTDERSKKGKAVMERLQSAYEAFIRG